MEHILKMGAFGGVFAVPNIVVDNFIKLANESAVKVLLYMLRNKGKQCSTAEIAKAINITEAQAEEAFVFWENANIFSGDIGSDTMENAEPVKTEPPKKIILPSAEKYNLSPSEIAARIEGSPEIRNLFSMAESSFGRMLNHSEHRGFIWMHDDLGLSAEVILMITAYSISINSGNINYIKKTAADWAERGITTLDRAEAEVKLLEEKNTFQGKIMRIFHMQRALTANEKKIADEWNSRLYNDDLIEYAYERTAENINKLNFKYIDSILKGWEQKGIRTRADAESDNKDHKDKETGHSFDLEEYKALVNDFGE